MSGRQWVAVGATVAGVAAGLALWLGLAPPIKILGRDAPGQAGLQRVLGRDASRHAEPERPENHIDVRGTDAMLRFAQLVAEDYMGKNPGVTVTASGGGAARGLMSVVVGTADIALTSDDIPEDLRKLARARKVDLEQVPVYRDMIYVLVDKNNPVTKLTIPQVRDIFSGKATSWKAFGGPEQPIVVINHEAHTSAFNTFKRTVLGDDLVVAREAKTPPLNQFAAEMNHNKWAIGYEGAELGLQPVDIDGVRPSLATLESGEYKLQRQLSMVYRKNPRKAVYALVEFFNDRDKIRASAAAVHGVLPPPSRPEK